MDTDPGLKAPVKKFSDTFSGEDAVMNWLRIDWRRSDYGCRVRDKYGNVKHCCFPFEEI